jgi:hypothetical protein
MPLNLDIQAYLNKNKELYARLTWLPDLHIHVHLKRSCMLAWLPDGQHTFSNFAHDIIFTLIQSTFPDICSLVRQAFKDVFFHWMRCFFPLNELCVLYTDVRQYKLGGPTSTFPCYHACYCIFIISHYLFCFSTSLVTATTKVTDSKRWHQPKGPSSSLSLVGFPAPLCFPNFLLSVSELSSK